MDWALYFGRIFLLVILHEFLHFVVLRFYRVDFKVVIGLKGIGFFFDETKYPLKVTLLSLAAPLALLPLAAWWGWVYLVIYIVASGADLVNIAWVLRKGRGII